MRCEVNTLVITCVLMSRGRPMEKLTTTLSARDRVILFCVATATDYGTVGITAHTMQSMAIRGFIAHDS